MHPANRIAHGDAASGRRSRAVIRGSHPQGANAISQTSRAMTPTPPDNAIGAMALLTALAVLLVLVADWVASLLR